MRIFPLLFVLASAPFGRLALSAPAAKPKAVAPKPAPSVWKPATGVQRAAVAMSIRAQLDAFKRDDWAKAATFQSEGLRRNFGTLAQFRAVIETNYPQFANYKTISFADARARGDQVQMLVRLTGQDGVKLTAVYLMKKEKGLYRVEGVQGGGASGGSGGREPQAPGISV